MFQCDAAVYGNTPVWMPSFVTYPVRGLFSEPLDIMHCLGDLARTAPNAGRIMPAYTVRRFWIDELGSSLLTDSVTDYGVSKSEMRDILKTPTKLNGLPRLVQLGFGTDYLLHCSDGVTIHKLTRIELLHLRLGFTSVSKLDQQYNSDPCKGSV
jgi:hypothetical protein